MSVDDFGTGYSSLSYLHQFPVDILKIDRSFVSGLAHSAESQQIVTTIMALANGMGMKVVAEGIETREQAAELRRVGCTFGQGYLFSRPLSLPDAEALLQHAMRAGTRRSDDDAMPGETRQDSRAPQAHQDCLALVVVSKPGCWTATPATGTTLRRIARQEFNAC